MDEEAITLKIPEYSKRVNIGENRMRAIAKSPGFPVLHIGRKILVLVRKADEWLIEHAEDLK